MQEDPQPSSPELSSTSKSSPYAAQSKNSPNTNGRSNHITTIKSLGLLHDLKVRMQQWRGAASRERAMHPTDTEIMGAQEYITNVEAVAIEQKRELERIKEEKKDIEKAVYRIEVHGDKSAFADFTSSAITDMPPKLRAVFEENKVRLHS